MNKIIFKILALCLLVSCSSTSSKYKSTNRFIKEDGRVKFFNNSIKYSITLAGDYQYTDKGVELDHYYNSISSSKFKQNTKLIKKVYPEFKVKTTKDNFVFKASTYIEPYFSITLFYYPNAEVCADTVIFDSINRTALSVKCDNKHAYLHILHNDSRNNTNGVKNRSRKDIYKDLFSSLKSESRQIFKSTRLGKEETVSSASNIFIDTHGDNYNYLTPISKSLYIKDNYTTTSEKWEYLQASATFNSFVQNNYVYNETISNLYNFLETISKTKKKEINIKYYDSDVLDYIKQESRNKQVVMINEQHWQPKHRYLCNMLLEHFYNEGFKYFAVEAVNEEQDSLNARKYPIQSTGTYTREPNLANVIRNAIDMGYTIIQYDASGKNREQKQAENIYNKTLLNNPDAKMLVWAGVAHIKENKSERPKMGYYFKEMSGIDPLTISQTNGDFYTSEIGSHYLALTIDSTINYCDISLINNIPESEFKINPNVESKRIEFPETMKSIAEDYGGKCIFQIFNRKEFEKEEFKAIPLLNYIIFKRAIYPEIQLPSGNYILILRNEGGEIIEQINVKI